MTVHEDSRARVAAFVEAYYERSLGGEVIAEVAEPESGVCHCGAPTDHHSVGDGHSPVDTAGGRGELLLAGDLRLLTEASSLEQPLRASLEELIGAPDDVQQWADVTGEADDDEAMLEVEVINADRIRELLDDPFPDQPYVDRRRERPTVPQSWPENRHPTTEEFLDWLLELPRPEQLEVIGSTLSYARESHTCFIANHTARLEMADRDQRWLLGKLRSLEPDALEAPVAP